jgi:hypothetical protein
MRILIVGCLCAMAVGAAFADHFVVGSKGSMAYYPFRGC